MRVLGVDFGGKRIGLAVGDSESGLASPKPLLTASGTLKKDAEAIAQIARTEEVDAIVVGLPCMEEDTRMTGICRQLAERIRDTGFDVYLVDEALTTVEAESRLYDAGLKASVRKKYRDAEAACLILERFFDSREGSTNSETS